MRAVILSNISDYIRNVTLFVFSSFADMKICAFCYCGELRLELFVILEKASCLRLKSMLIIIRNGEKLSSKTKFLVQLCQNFNIEIFYIFKPENASFSEEWGHNKVQLASSKYGIFLYYLLMLFKSPKDIRNGLMARLSLVKRKNVLIGEGLLSILSRTLYLHLGSSAQNINVMNFLKNMVSPKIFLVDEFVSLNFFDLKKLRLLGSVIYVSSDVAHNRFGFGDNIMTKTLMLRLEKDALRYVDLTLACSEMERLKYLEMGAKNAIYYPNTYPTKEFELLKKDEQPSITIVLRGHWGSAAEASLEEIFDALACIKRQVKVYMIGILPKKTPKNVCLEYWDFLPSKLDYLKLLSKSWIGVNLGIHKAGTNERKYDYAEAGLVVVSDNFGVRGDLFPHEYTYVDAYDLAGKLGQLLELGRMRLSEMGAENRKVVISLAEERRQKLLDCLSQIIIKSS